MKKEGHPDYHPVCFVDVGTGSRIFTRSTLKTRQKEVIDGVEYYVAMRDVTSFSHPVYTGEKRFVGGAESRIQKFNNKFKRS